VGGLQPLKPTRFVHCRAPSGLACAEAGFACWMAKGWRQGPLSSRHAVRNLVAAGQGTAADNVASLRTDTARSA
jgi:hypothetical protein